MPTINPQLVPTIAPGRIFSRFTTDDTLNVRWLVAKDPCYYEVLNRPVVDVALRSLILAKAVDTLYASLGHNALYPFLIQPRIASGLNVADVPINWIWSLNIVVPKKWQNIRLAKIKRISGENGTDNTYSGLLRLVFSALQVGYPQETYLFYVDYQIDSVLSYQIAKLNVTTILEESYVINQDEAETITGSITFSTMDTTELLVSQFLDILAEPTNPIDSNSDGIYDNPSVYEIVDSLGGGTTADNDFSTQVMVHGTGLITESAWTGLPQLDSDAQSWINAMNYPFDQNANLTSVGGIEIPHGLFREFSIVVPAGDQPSTTSTDYTYFPVWVDSAQLISSNHVRLFFSTYNTTEVATGGSPSLLAIQFAYLDIYSTGRQNDRLPIIPYHNLKLNEADPLYSNSGAESEFTQHFGRGHVVLSSIWTMNPTAISGFFDAMALIQESPAITDFSASSTRISSFGTSSVPRYTPTAGQSRALTGSTSRLAIAVTPSEDNRFVTEQDQGLGNTIDLEAQQGITPSVAIERYGYSGGLCHKIVKMIVYADQLPSSPNFYDTYILPRLRVLLGRDPCFGDVWYNGTRFVTYNGDSFQD